MNAPVEITVPRLGWSMEEGTLTEWLKRDGEWVERGEMLFVLEGDKAAQEIESFESGILRMAPDAPRAGDTVKVGQVIGYLIERGDVAPFAEKTAAPPASETATPAVTKTPPPAAGPAARRLARELGVDLAHVTGSGRGGRIVAADVRRITSAGHRSHHAPRDALAAEAGRTAQRTRATDELQPLKIASPRARRVARELGIDWTQLPGTGRGGRVRERDVHAAAAGGKQAPASTSLSARRRVIADRMVASRRTTAPVTLTSRASATNLLSLRAQFKAAAASGASETDAIVPSITDLLVKLAATALLRHPQINSRWQDDGIVTAAEVHIGVAVDDPSGLIVPVLHDVPSLSVRHVASRTRELIERAHAHRLSAEEMKGATFTVTNLGMFGIDAFTPIIDVPQTAILGVGAIRREPVVASDDRIVPGDVMTLSLTFDHRAVDGAPAARFLQTLVAMIENPAPWLVA